MRYASAIAAILAALPVQAADLGKPATVEDIIAMRNTSLGRCYVETSVAGTFLRADRHSSVGIGGGCDATLANMVVGGGLRGEWVDGTGITNGSVFAKLGIAINNGATTYLLAEWKLDDLKARVGKLAVGAGAELSLNFINPNLSAFTEFTYDAASWGSADRDAANIRFGARYKF